MGVDRTAADPRVGLCSVCRHSRQVVSGRGSTFWLCEAARTDPRLRRYPALPVVSCHGFVHREDSGLARA